MVHSEDWFRLSERQWRQTWEIWTSVFEYPNFEDEIHDVRSSEVAYVKIRQVISFGIRMMGAFRVYLVAATGQKAILTRDALFLVAGFRVISGIMSMDDRREIHACCSQGQTRVNKGRAVRVPVSRRHSPTTTMLGEHISG